LIYIDNIGKIDYIDYIDKIYIDNI